MLASAASAKASAARTACHVPRKGDSPIGVLSPGSVHDKKMEGRGRGHDHGARVSGERLPID
ncbi:hypothetical protein, partial [Staphylococcus aureus]|uniref:hypothetical protein n=1 Tax=Staphylococcus aureus TaxID=1280 RepID=UPI001F465F6E